MNPIENFQNLHPIVGPHHSQIMDMAVMVILFTELPEFQLHYDHVIDSLYITATCRGHLYIFFRQDFVVPLFHPLFNLATPFLILPLHMAHPKEPPAVPPVSPPASPPQVVPSLSSDDDPFEVADSSSSSSSGPNNDYAPANTDMANGFFSSESI